MTSEKVEDGVAIHLSNEEALVLSDWLFFFNKNSLNTYEDQAEERIFWDMEAVLEKTLSESLASNYSQQLSRARQKVRD